MKSSKIKDVANLAWNTIVGKKEESLNDKLEKCRILSFGSAFLAIVSVILTVMNITNEYWAMMVTTIVLFVGFVVAALIAFLRRTIAVPSIIIALMTSLLFSVYVINGSNEGFAALWVMLVPIGAMYLIGLKYGIIMSAYFQLFLVAMFYIPPLRDFIDEYYTETFLNRFPIIYLAEFIGTTALFIQKEHYNAKAVGNAYRDGLTNLKNRLFFNGMLKKYSKPGTYHNLVIAEIDLNRLKYLNDNFGHDVGDEAIRAVADCMLRVWGKTDNKRSNDQVVLARTGGDEYSILSLVDEKKFLEEVDIFKEEISKLDEILGNKISISIGFVFRKEEPSLEGEDLLKIADKRMYEDKDRFYKESGLDRRGNSK